jgi:formate hydrogenlyase subunit 3/multisubunit Na+/H+ antiporter MnhD subunit
MPNELLGAAAVLWIAGGGLALTGTLQPAVRLLLAAGCAAAIAAALVALPHGGGTTLLPTRVGLDRTSFHMAPEALWLMGFGLLPALLATASGTPLGRGRAGWLFGAAASLLGALGVFGVQDGAAFLVAWELMSLGGAVMILSEGSETRRGRTVLFMLALLEVGSVALLGAVLVLSNRGGAVGFDHYLTGAAAMPGWLQLAVAIALIAGFGAKLGLLPFYEWFPHAYGSGSGASGALLSGVIINAAFFGLGRALLEWLPGQHGHVGIVLTLVGVASAILTILYAFQQDDWRKLLSFSSAENASITVTALGAALIFRADGQADLGGLAWAVGIIHLSGHALAKGGLFLAADGIRETTGSYRITYANLSPRSPWLFGVGALFAAMSLAAMPPQAGFVSEWFVFQTVFQSFHLSDLGSRLVLALAGAGLALTAAVALATFIKVFGIGILGRDPGSTRRISAPRSFMVGLLGSAVLAFAVGMPFWLPGLENATAAHFTVNVATRMHDGLLLVPLTSKFAFISPTKLVLAMPLLALIPAGLLVLAVARRRVRRAPVWYGGQPADRARAATTALAFSNALRTFYSFVYRPTVDTKREIEGRPYFVKRIVFSEGLPPIFEHRLFMPIANIFGWLSEKVRLLQSGDLNAYLGLIGLLLIIILGLTLV